MNPATIDSEEPKQQLDALESKASGILVSAIKILIQNAPTSTSTDLSIFCYLIGELLAEAERSPGSGLTLIPMMEKWITKAYLTCQKEHGHG